MPLHEPIGVVAGEPRLDERQQQPLAEVQPEARRDVLAHPLLAHDEALDEPGEPIEHVVDGEERVGQDDPLGRGVGDVPLVPEGDVLETDERVGPHDARDPADALGRDRVALVRHRRRALLAAAERLLDLAHLGAREVADLGREAVERRGEQRQRREQLGVTVALQDLRRARSRLEAEPLAGDALHLGLGGRVRADGAGELADAQALDRAHEPLPVAIERERPAGELEAEGRRLGVDAVRATHADRLPVLLGADDDGAEGAIETLEHERARVLHRERERRVEHVRRGEPVVEPAPLLAEPLGGGVDERRDIVVRLALDLGHALRRRQDDVLADRGDVLVRDGADLGPALERCQFDVEPAAQLLAVRPDLAHGRAGVASDHRVILERPGLRRAVRSRPGRPIGALLTPGDRIESG